MAIPGGLLGSLELLANRTKDVARRCVFPEHARVLSETVRGSVPDYRDRRSVKDRSARLIATLLGTLLFGESPTVLTPAGLAAVVCGLMPAFTRSEPQWAPTAHRRQEAL